MAGFGDYSITDILNGIDESLVLTGGGANGLTFGPVSGLDSQSLVLTQGELGLGNTLPGVSGTVSLMNNSGRTGFGLGPAAFADGATSGTLNAGVAAASLQLVVTTTEDVSDPDDGVLSLREAVQMANDNPGEDEITFDPKLYHPGGVVDSPTMYLENGELVVTDSLRINGGPINFISISGGGASPIFNISGDTTKVTLENLILRDGRTVGNGGAINIHSPSGSLEIYHCLFHYNGAHGSGSAIASNETFVSIIDSVIFQNYADNNGGGIFIYSAGLNIIQSAFSINGANGKGGAVAAQFSIVNSVGVDFYENRADVDKDNQGASNGGGISTESGILNLFNTVTAGNVSGGSASTVVGVDGGVYASGSSLALASGGVADDISGTINNATNSFFGANVTITNDTNNIINGGDPMLGELLDNGGGVLTLSPLDGSPLIDAGSNADIPQDTYDVDNDGNTTEPLPLDARGGLRIVGGKVDIGAVEHITNESIGGTDKANHIIGGLGKDTMSGLGGADTIDGGDGNDIGSGDDGSDSLIGGDGNDRLAGGLGKDTIKGGAGDDRLSGNGGPDLIIANGGDDRVNGGSGNDVLNGGGGDDSLNGNSGADTIIGGAGNDKANGGGGADQIAGGGGDDSLNGNNGNDILNGNAGADVLNGTAGADSLNGGGGGDVLNGGGGRDDIKGGGGHDTIDGGKGGDYLSGGAMTDTFAFSGDFGHDTVSGFSANNHEDIDLSGVSAITGFHDLTAHHLTTDDNSGFAMITDGTSNTILLVGFTVGDFGAGQPISGADFIFA